MTAAERKAVDRLVRCDLLDSGGPFGSYGNSRRSLTGRGRHLAAHLAEETA